MKQMIEHFKRNVINDADSGNNVGLSIVGKEVTEIISRFPSAVKRKREPGKHREDKESSWKA